jgi:hypothetical protein
MADDNATDTEVFIYTGLEEVPDDVVRVQVDPSVMAIPEISFASSYLLENVELHEDLREIGPHAFSGCTALNDVQSSDGVESIGSCAFFSCYFTKFRSPPLVITIPFGMLGECGNLLSLELPENIIHVKGNACFNCHSLRNVALASNTVVEENAFMSCLDLLHIFDTEEAIIDALRIRFVGLLIHSIVYYKSYYHQMSVEEFCNAITIGKNGELNPSGLQQDCLGMTPLHILTCSTVHHLEIYQFMVEKYPASLIVRDA